MGFGSSNLEFGTWNLVSTTSSSRGSAPGSVWRLEWRSGRCGRAPRPALAGFSRGRNNQPPCRRPDFSAKSTSVPAEQNSDVPPRIYLSHNRPLHLSHIVRCTQRYFGLVRHYPCYMKHQAALNYAVGRIEVIRIGLQKAGFPKHVRILRSRTCPLG